MNQQHQSTGSVYTQLDTQSGQAGKAWRGKFAPSIFPPGSAPRPRSGLRPGSGALTLRVAAVFLGLFASTLSAAFGQAPQDRAFKSAPVTLQGQLTASPGRAVLKVSGKEYPLSASATYVLHTLQDRRLSGREIRVQGTPKPDGTFEVEKFFTLHNGKPYRVRYYCETCNIAALEPGRCACCQQPTALQEIPLGGTDQDAIVLP
jgi:hypothetical protein